jgi:Photosynthetic reaction centre cytochrome C subunit/Tetratricopeptide repeat
MQRFSIVSALIGVLLVTVTISAQQAPAGGGRAGGAAPQGGGGRGGGPQVSAPKNLQFFPKDMTGQQILPIMQNFNAALGVNCTYCHNSEPPVDNPKNDFASDEKETKKKARVMLVLARDVNMKLQSELGKPANQLTNVQCVTCHRGVAIPKQLTAIVMETAGKDGVAKALQQYQDLRKQYYGAQAYDFTDASLFNAANQSLMANKPDDAIAFAQLNLAFHATSARSYQVLSQAYQRKNDKDKAIQALEKAVEIDPMNQGFKNQLQQLKAGA